VTKGSPVIRMALICAALVACGVNPTPYGDTYLFTLDQLVPGSRDGTWPLANDIITPAGGTIALLSPPYSNRVVKQAAGLDGINIHPAFVEGGPAAYATTEAWTDWPGPVWVQPLYFVVSGFDALTGNPNFVLNPTTMSPTPVFGIGTDSKFYSSYWQVYYLNIPAGVDAGQFTSSKAVLDSGYPLIEGALTFCALGPATTNLVVENPDTGSPIVPITNLPIQLRGHAAGWVEGEMINFIDFGRSRFTRDDTSSDPAIVEADVLFQFAVRNPADGSHKPLDLPRVGGSGPYGHHKAPQLVQGRPQFGTLWHEYQVVINPAAQLSNGATAPGFFVPNSEPLLRQKVVDEALGQTQWSPAPDPSLDSLDPGVAAAHTLRLALNPTQCFVQPNPLFGKTGDPCIWLDSQVAVEHYFPAALIYDTDRLDSCPLVEYQGVEVAP
jgi:hypothetical protein